MEEHRGSAADLHALDLPPVLGLHVMSVTAPAVVLGSTQSRGVLDDAAVDRAGLEVASRRSGGGFVVVVPGECAWVDVVVPSTDARWHPDVGVAFDWLGAAWVEALDRIGRPGGEVCRAAEATPAGRIACFAGLGRGEVIVGGAKVVGISQRRTREAARFQCLVHGVFDVATNVALVASDEHRAVVGQRLAAPGVGVVDDPTLALDALRSVVA